MTLDPHDRQLKDPSFLRNPSESDWPKRSYGRMAGKDTPQPDEARVPVAQMISELLENVSEEVLSRIAEWNSFAALAVEIDPPVKKEPPEALTPALAEIFEAARDSDQAVWFHWKDALFGCLCPDRDMQTGLALAEQMQTRLQQTRVETVTIGVAAFPLNSYTRTETLANACKALDHAAFFSPSGKAGFNAVSLNISADQCYQDGQLSAAVAEYRAALKLDPNNVNVHNSLGVCLAQMQDLPAARKCFQDALAIDAEEAMAIYNMGALHLMEEDFSQALSCFKNAYALDQETFEIPFQIGRLHTEQSQFEDAGFFLQRAIELRENSPAVHGLLGQCLEARGQILEAIASYKKCVKLNPNDADALSALGTLYDAKGENPEICMTFCRQSVHLAPHNGLFHLRLASLYHKYNQLEQAIAEYQKAVDLGFDCQQQIEETRRQMEADDPKSCCA